MSVKNFLFAITVSLLAGNHAFAQGLNPSPRHEYESLPTIEAAPTVTYTVQLTVGGQTVTEQRMKTLQPIETPPKIDLTPYCPPPLKQSFQDCVGWAVAYCSLTTQFDARPSNGVFVVVLPETAERKPKVK